MAGIESSNYVKRLAERERLEGRISRIGEACQLFAKGFEEGVLTFIEFRGPEGS